MIVIVDVVIVIDCFLAPPPAPNLISKGAQALYSMDSHQPLQQEPYAVPVSWNNEKLKKQQNETVVEECKEVQECNMVDVVKQVERQVPEKVLDR